MINTFTARISATVAAITVVSIPYVASAQGFFSGGSFEGFVGDIESLVNSLIPVIAALALVAFFVGLAMYVFNANDEEGRERGKQTMIAGIVALFLIAAIGGIINFLTDAAGTGQGENFNVTNPVDFNN